MKERRRRTHSRCGPALGDCCRVHWLSAGSQLGVASHRGKQILINDMTMRLSNEFAAVEIARDERGNGPRLMIRDLQSGQEIFLDPLELAALAWTRHEELLPLLDPGRLERENRT
jgi:hypothetical protein